MVRPPRRPPGQQAHSPRGGAGLTLGAAGTAPVRLPGGPGTGWTPLRGLRSSRRPETSAVGHEGPRLPRQGLRFSATPMCQPPPAPQGRDPRTGTERQ